MRRVIVVCNAIDDATRLERGITTDSPAASRKVFQLCVALRRAGVRPCVLSLGRGRAGRSTAYFGRRVRRVQGIPVVYAPFSMLRGLSELISLVAPLSIVWRLNRPGTNAMIFYNREIAYLPTLLLASRLGFRNVLDLEDGEVAQGSSSRSGLISRLVRKTYDRLCSAGALLACRALEAATSIRPVRCYYGTAQPSATSARWMNDDVTVVLGGTIAPDTGADLLIEAIRQLRRSSPAWAAHLRIEVTGKGPSLAALAALTEATTGPRVRVHGRLSDTAYRQLMERSEAGLALKPNDGGLARTTFPSKVVELASAGLLVISTDISDVREVLDGGALFLEHDDPAALVELLRLAVEDRSVARQLASKGAQAVWARCAPAPAGRAVADFVFGVAH